MVSMSHNNGSGHDGKHVFSPVCTLLSGHAVTYHDKNITVQLTTLISLLYSKLL